MGQNRHSLPLYRYIMSGNGEGVAELFAPKLVPVSGYLANLFDLRWQLDRFGYDPCDPWDIDSILDLPDGLTFVGGAVKFECESCGTMADWEGEISDFEIGHYANRCGGSPRCIP